MNYSVYHYYHPQRRCEGYVFTRVCDSVHKGRGGVLSQHALQVVYQHALQQGGAWSGGCLVQGGLLLGGTAPGGVCSQGVPGWGVPGPGGSAPGGGCGDPTQKQTATVADGTHLTGTHSC